MKTIHILLLVFVLWVILQDRNDGYQIEKYSISGLATDQCWYGLAYSPDLFMWVATGYSTTGLEYGCSAYSYDSYHWFTVDPTTGGIPIQSWQSVAYGMTQNGPLFVAGAQIYNGPNTGPQGTSNYTSATSTDGINWQPNNSLPTFTSWEIYFDSVNQQFIAGGSTSSIHNGISGTTMYSSPDGINWTLINSIQGFNSSAMCEGLNQIVTVGSVNSSQVYPLVYQYDETNSLSTFQPNGSNLPTGTFGTYWYKDVSYINKLYYTCNWKSLGVYSSLDGINWTQVILNGIPLPVYVVSGPPLLVRYFNGLYIVATSNDIYFSSDINGQFTPCYKTWKGAISPTRCEHGTNVDGVDKIVIICCFNYNFAAVTSHDGMTWFVTV